MATIGYGSKLSLGDGVSAALVEIPYLSSISVPDAEAQIVEATHLGSSGRLREYIPGLIEPGNFGFTGRFDKATYARLLAVKGASKAWKIEWPDTSNATFNAILTKTDCEMVADGVVDVKSEAKVAGAVTFTPAS